VRTSGAGHATPLYPQQLTLSSPTGIGRPAGMVLLRTKSHGVLFCLFGWFFFFLFFVVLFSSCISSGLVAISSAARCLAPTSCDHFSKYNAVKSLGIQLEMGELVQRGESEECRLPGRYAVWLL
jgi:hypothetical protein